MRSAALLALVAAAAVSAQKNYSSSLDMEVDPGTVEDDVKAGWCTAQTNTCNTLCDKNTKKNDCGYTDLSYKCICGANNSAPGLQYYTETMPTFICQTLFSQCIEQNPNDQKGQDDCKDNIKDLCGTVNPSKASKGGDSDNDDSSSSTSSEASKPTKTSSGGSDKSDKSDKSDVTSTNSDGFAAPTSAPKGVAAMAAAGLLAALV